MDMVGIMLHNIDTRVCAEYSKHVSIDAINSAMQDAISFLNPTNDNLTISILITDNKNIAQLNRSFRGIPESTDVLSFPPEGISHEEPGVTELEADQLGDIVISYEEIERQSTKYRQSREEVLNFLLIHGLLHLSGYDHTTPEEQSHMQHKESDLLNQLNIPDNIVYKMYEAHGLEG